MYSRVHVHIHTYERKTVYRGITRSPYDIYDIKVTDRAHVSKEI